MPTVTVALPRLRPCANCRSEFSTEGRRGRPSRFCSTECRRVHTAKTWRVGAAAMDTLAEIEAQTLSR